MHMILDWQKTSILELVCCEILGTGLTDAKDLRGPWCYVAADQCPDAEQSQVFPQLMLSYKVCSYLKEPVGSRWSVGEFHHALDLDLHLHGAFLEQKKS